MQKEIPQLSEYAATFKTKYDASIVLVSLDTDKNEYRKFMSENPNFIFSCDFKMWEGSNVKNYYVNASPTLFILNETNKIVANQLLQLTVLPGYLKMTGKSFKIQFHFLYNPNVKIYK